MNAAERIIQKVGSVKLVAEIAGVTTNWVSRWKYPEDRGGTDGEIPGMDSPAMKLLLAGRRGEIPISLDDFSDDDQKAVAAE